MTHKAVDLNDPGTASKGLREALSRFVTGVTVITTRTVNGSLEGLTANSFSALSLDPPLVLWSLRNNASSFKAFTDETDRFAVNVLDAAQQDVSRRFAVSSREKFVDFDWEQGLGGCPLIPGSIARFECLIESLIPGGDHVVFIGRVERASFRSGEPLLFHAGAYCVPAPIGRTVPIRPDIAAHVELAIETSHFL
jgi:flavin reductase (DIM6/NTAB) family NADH-FMN oxidoreductase RutF